MTYKEKEVFSVCRPADALFDGKKNTETILKGFFSLYLTEKKQRP